ncbi:MAG: sodium:proton antiporter, partial [Bacteroidaceae bacterium]|nr:sodium:proton antiporter [Bacteroidaceae bacterium]
SVVAASVAMLIMQPDVVASLGGETQGAFAVSVNAVLTAVCNSTAIETGNETLNSLVTTGGMSGMLNTIWLILAAMCFGGVLMGSGMASTITHYILKGVRGVVGAVSTTVFSGLFFNLCTADQYMSIILTGDLNKEGFDRLGIDRRVLSRATEDSATVLSVLVPWNSCGIAQSAVLGISTIAYFPFCFFNLLSPVMSVVVAALGYKILYKKDKSNVV